MSNILVRPPQLRSTAQNLEQRARALLGALERVDQILKELSAVRFEGNRATTLRGRYARTREKIFAAPGMIEHFARDLVSAAVVFEKADQQSGGKTGEVPLPTPVPTPAPQKPINDPGEKTNPPDVNVNSPKTSTPVSNIGLIQNNYTDVMGDNGMTINNVGCLITDVAMIARFYGKDVTPQDVNNFLQANQGYKSGSSELYWGKAAEFINSTAGTHGSFVDMPKGDISSALSSGNPVIIHVPSNTEDGHYLLAIPGGDGKNIVAFDPWTGKQTTVSPESIKSIKAFTAGNVQE